MADYPLRSATDRRLGEPLPHQPANQTQAHPLPINLWQINHVIRLHYEVLIPVSRGYPSVRGRLPTRYSPVRRFPLNPSSEESFMSFTLDLHVLGTPPAFILSQDQTLNNNCILRRFRLTTLLMEKRNLRYVSFIVCSELNEVPFNFLTWYLYFDSISALCSFQGARPEKLSFLKRASLSYHGFYSLSTPFFYFFQYCYY